jgi:type II secretory ATPase GspE/PulE/Tfp pilus assembly ATPase PilB-like protein
MHAAMTGHLVLSTLHTNSAAATLPRMLDMGAEAFLIASTVNVIVAQRLVRRLCVECRETYTLDEKELASLAKSYNLDEVFSYLKNDKVAKKYVGEAKDFSQLQLYKSVGCDQCGGEGYKGRNGIYEVLEMTTEVRKLVTQEATTEQLNEQAKKEGMASMVEDGFRNIIQGVTSLEEVMRVTKE